MDSLSWPEIHSFSVTYFESSSRNWSPQVVPKDFLTICMVPQMGKCECVSTLLMPGGNSSLQGGLACA